MAKASAAKSHGQAQTLPYMAGTVARAYSANRRGAIESVIEADPVAACVRELMVNRDHWIGTASDFLLLADKLQRQEVLIRRPDWPRTPRALAGRLRRAQTSLRALGIDIAFQREGREGSRIIRMRGLSSGSSASAPASAPT